MSKNSKSDSSTVALAAWVAIGVTVFVHLSSREEMRADRQLLKAEMEDTNKRYENELALSKLPYLHLVPINADEGPAPGFSEKHPDATSYISFVVENLGQTPLLDVALQLEAFQDWNPFGDKIEWPLGDIYPGEVVRSTYLPIDRSTGSKGQTFRS